MDDQRMQTVDTLLSALIGAWEGVVRTWFEPDALADESPMRGTFRRVGASRFALYEYTGTFQGSPLSGVAIYGYNQHTDAFESAWVDSFHMPTNIMLSHGSAAAPALDVRGSYIVDASPPWGWRTTITHDGADRLVLTAYNRSPDGAETKAVEVIYTRAAQ